ncbi:MAG: phage holin family protein [Phycisphaeraceae bacterium]
MRPVDDPRTFGQLLGDLRSDTSALFRHEIALAKVELKEKARSLGRDGVYFGAGAGLGALAAMTLVAAISIALAVALAPLVTLAVSSWLGPLIVAIALGVGAYVCIRVGQRRLKEEPMTPERTTESLRETKQWAQSKVKS